MADWCATTSLERAEPLAATASRVERWLLVEHTGAWGPQSVPSGRLGVTIAKALAAAAAAAGARLLLIRRFDGEATAGARQVYAVDSRPGHELVLGRQVTDDDELLSLHVPVPLHLPPGPSAGWLPVREPLLLVCTHGRHDRCCATRGRPVARALWERWPATTWECSHVGGDRFAANVVVLPDGLYLGRLTPADVVAQVEALAGGALPAGHVRGRSSLTLPAQAAQGFAREQLGRWGREDLAPLGQEHAGADRWRVRLGGSPEVHVVVRYDRAGDGDARVLSCGADPKTATVFRLVELQVLAPA